MVVWFGCFRLIWISIVATKRFSIFYFFLSFFLSLSMLNIILCSDIQFDYFISIGHIFCSFPFLAIVEQHNSSDEDSNDDGGNGDDDYSWYWAFRCQSIRKRVFKYGFYKVFPSLYIYLSLSSRSSINSKIDQETEKKNGSKKNVNSSQTQWARQEKKKSFAK